MYANGESPGMSPCASGGNGLFSAGESAEGVCIFFLCRKFAGHPSAVADQDQMLPETIFDGERSGLFVIAYT